MSAALTSPAAASMKLEVGDFRALAALMHRETGVHLPDAKHVMVEGRLAKRLRALGLESFARYRALVESPEGEVERARMLEALTTNVTRFNREPHHFDFLRREVMPSLVARAQKGGRIRLWSAACSSGEEPYSIGLSVLSAVPEGRRFDVRILATDVNAAMVARGERGIYDRTALSQVPAPERDRWFVDTPDQRLQAGPDLRGLIRFRVLNLIGSWPMTGHFDAVFCRNVVIYFDAPTQERLWARMAAVIPEGGYLFVGHSERLTGPAARIFRQVGLTTYLRDGGMP